MKGEGGLDRVERRSAGPALNKRGARPRNCVGACRALGLNRNDPVEAHPNQQGEHKYKYQRSFLYGFFSFPPLYRAWEGHLARVESSSIMRSQKYV